MNAEELKAALQPFYDHVNEIGVSVYAVLKGSEDSAPKKLDIEAEAAQGLKSRVRVRSRIKKKNS